MAIPIPPLAALAVRYAVVASAAYIAAQRIERGRMAQPVEDEMDATPEGIRVRRAGGQVNGSARLQRVIRLGRSGPGVQIDTTFLGRIRVGGAS